MTDAGRFHLSRGLVIASLIGFTYGLATYTFSARYAVVLGRYSWLFFILLCLSVLASTGLIALTFRPVYRNFITGEDLRLKLMLAAGWLPLLLITYTIGWEVTSYGAALTRAYKSLLWLGTPAILIMTLNIWGKVVRKPEFWARVAYIVVGLVLAEAGARVWLATLPASSPVQGYKELLDPATFNARTAPRFVPHPYLPYRLNPEFRSENGLDRINSMGFRGEEIAIPKPEGVFRIVAIGGSTAYDTAVEDWHQSHTYQLEQILRDEYGYTQVEVINAGVAGYSSWENLISLELFVLEMEPDLIVIYENNNDVHARFVNPSDYRSDNSGRRKPWDSELYKTNYHSWQLRVPSVLWRILLYTFNWYHIAPLNIDNLVAQPCTGPEGVLASQDCFKMSADDVLDANPPTYFKRNVENMIAIAHTHGSEVLLLTYAYSTAKGDFAAEPFYIRGFEEMNDVIREIAVEMDVPFYDFAADMPPDLVYWHDGRHMSAEGLRVRAKLLAAYLDSAGLIPPP